MNMNPHRSDDLAAQERVVQLERELAEKNQLIYKLQKPAPKKPKTPRKPINWSVLSTRGVKIIGVCACFGVLFYACEPNKSYTSDGIITYVGKAQMKTVCYGPTEITFENGETKTRNTQCTTHVGYNIKASFLDVNGKMRETFAEAFEQDEWVLNDNRFPPKKKFNNCRIIYPKNMNYLRKGCAVKVYFLRSIFLKTRPWAQDPKIDASTCGK